MLNIEAKHPSWLDRPLSASISLSWETAVFVVILVLAFASRFYDLQARVMSHDENSHVYYSWLYYEGRGYTHDPITHGPLQFHLLALTFFLFSPNDFTARIPAALFSVAAVLFIWKYKRYLGRIGAILASIMMLISPYMLFYGRYVRNEAFIALFGVVLLWAILRYIETGQKLYLYLTTLMTVLHFTAKETAFIYTAQALIFLALFLVYQVSQKTWRHPQSRNRFLIALIVALLLVGVAGGLGLAGGMGANLSATETAAPAIPGQGLQAPATGAEGNFLTLGLLGLAGLVAIAGLYFLISGYTWQRLRRERAFDLFIVMFTMVLPMLAPFPVKALKVNPINYNDPHSIQLTAIFVIILAAIAIGIGLAWNWRLWLLNAGMFYAIFTVLYTSVFTNGFGFVTGLVGALGYWLEQQGVNRGNQPIYYYALIQIPVYEFLPAIGSLLALVLVLFRGKPQTEQIDPLPDGAAMTVSQSLTQLQERTEVSDAEQTETIAPPVVPLLGFWAVTSLLAYSVAGEKMPWLTVHITLPMILLSGWAIGLVVERMDWSLLREKQGWLVPLLLPVFILSFIAAAGVLLSTNPPFQGMDLDQLRSTTTFLTAFFIAVGSGLGLAYVVRIWPTGQFYRLLTLMVLAFLGVLTARTAYRAAFINYNDATEYLVYAHSAPGVKEALNQIIEISRRTTDGYALPVAHDDDTRYPFWWYLRDFTDVRDYGDSPTRSLQDVPIILVSDKNYGKIEQVVGQAYDEFDYIRLWWPNQDYFDLNWSRIWNAISDPQMRAAVFQIWFNRDYTLYGQLTNKDMSLPNWYPSARMRLYIRKDIVAKIWNYGVAPAPQALVTDPYAGKGITLNADQIIGSAGDQPGQFNRPRKVVVAPDGTLYVADTDNNRIQHLTADGKVLQVWGSYTGDNVSPAPPSTFNQPWGLAVGPDGSVYVADTWNHRIQKFTATGEFVKQWGFFGQANQPGALWGPRDIAIDSQGHLLVTDTGNKRVVVYDSDGNEITQFGEAGLGPGQFDEPVGIVIDSQGLVYVADTWNQRIQVFQKGADGTYTQVKSWDVAAWYGQSLDNKPYLAVDNQSHLFATDPEGNRVLEFSTSGEFVRYWGDLGSGSDTFNLTGAVAVDAEGRVWVSDVNNNRLMRFTLPVQ
jgi:predicted membrane-bound mannosyltransferase/sugar lactone lactonase YvrE